MIERFSHLQDLVDGLNLVLWVVKEPVVVVVLVGLTAAAAGGRRGVAVGHDLMGVVMVVGLWAVHVEGLLSGHVGHLGPVLMALRGVVVLKGVQGEDDVRSTATVTDLPVVAADQTLNGIVAANGVTQADQGHQGDAQEQRNALHGCRVDVGIGFTGEAMVGRGPFMDGVWGTVWRS